MSLGSFPRALAAVFRSSPRLVGALVVAWGAWAAMTLEAAPLPATKVFDGYEFDSGGHETIHVRASFISSGNELSLVLENLGPATKSKADVLTSFYFKVVDPKGTVAPQDIRLSWVSASGYAYQVLNTADGGTDVAASWVPKSWTANAPTKASNLVSQTIGGQGWQLRSDLVPTNDFEFTFGIGTVGNSGLAPFGFSGGLVNGTRYPGPTAGLAGKTQGGDTMINLGIYSDGGRGDIDPDGGLSTAVLVRNSATFKFTSDNFVFGNDPRLVLDSDAVFGFGTGPDRVISLPEPGTLPMAATFAGGGLAWAAWRRRRRG